VEVGQLVADQEGQQGSSLSWTCYTGLSDVSNAIRNYKLAILVYSMTKGMYIQQSSASSVLRPHQAPR
jgi:uncharacterized protein (DUF2225 family)